MTAHQDLTLDPADRRRIAEIAERLRRLPCANRVVTMELHRIARQLEALAEPPTAAADGAALRRDPARSAEQSGKELALADDP